MKMSQKPVNQPTVYGWLGRIVYKELFYQVCCSSGETQKKMGDQRTTTRILAKTFCNTFAVCLIGDYSEVPTSKSDCTRVRNKVKITITQEISFIDGTEI